MGARPSAVVLCAAEQNVALVIVVDGQILPDQLVDARFERGNIDIRLVLVEFEHEAVADIAVADFVSASTPEHSVFLTGNQHLNPVASLAGRTIVCGSDLYLYYHGFSTAQRKQEVQAFYEAPRDNLNLLARYGVQYVYVSPSEWSSYAVDAGALHTLFQTVYQSADGNYLVLAVPETYRLAAGVSTAAPAATPDPAVDPGSGG